MRKFQQLWQTKRMKTFGRGTTLKGETAVTADRPGATWGVKGVSSQRIVCQSHRGDSRQRSAPICFSWVHAKLCGTGMYSLFIWLIYAHVCAGACTGCVRVCCCCTHWVCACGGQRSTAAYQPARIFITFYVFSGGGGGRKCTMC